MIRVQNLDEAYAQTVSLFNTENNDGIELLGKMDTLIASLKEHWIGEDGTKHINRLIDIHDRLQKFIEVTLENTREAMVSVVNIQELRRSNGGGGEVGEIKQVASDFVKNIAKVESTAQYYIDPAISGDYTLLEEIEEKLKLFDTNVKAEKDDLMQNWIEGSNRDAVQANFDEIESLGTEAEKVVADVKQELSTSISNAQQIMD